MSCFLRIYLMFVVISLSVACKTTNSDKLASGRLNAASPNGEIECSAGNTVKGFPGCELYCKYSCANDKGITWSKVTKAADLINEIRKWTDTFSQEKVGKAAACAADFKDAATSSANRWDEISTRLEDPLLGQSDAEYVRGAAQSFCADYKALFSCVEAAEKIGGVSAGLTNKASFYLEALESVCNGGDILADFIQCRAWRHECKAEQVAGLPVVSKGSVCGNIRAMRGSSSPVADNGDVDWGCRDMIRKTSPGCEGLRSGNCKDIFEVCKKSAACECGDAELKARVGCDAPR